MSEVVRVKDDVLGIISYNNVRVISAYDIARLHNKEVKRVNEQFERNKERLAMNIDYFIVLRDEIPKSQIATLPPNLKELKLFTERGYLKLVKSFNDDLSWEIQDILVDHYFSTKERTLPQTYSQALRELADSWDREQLLLAENKTMKPKAEYFDALVDRNLLTNFRDTAKELKVKQNEFISYLLTHGYVYRDTKGKLKPHAQFTPHLFAIKEFKRGGYSNIQTLITPKGRETFRLLLSPN